MTVDQASWTKVKGPASGPTRWTTTDGNNTVRRLHHPSGPPSVSSTTGRSTRLRTVSEHSVASHSAMSDRSDDTSSSISTLTFELSNTYILPEHFLVICPFNCDKQRPFSRLHPLLDHLLSAHGIRIQQVGVVAGVVSKYLDNWAKRIEQTPALSFAMESFHDSLCPSQDGDMQTVDSISKDLDQLQVTALERQLKSSHVRRRVVLTLGVEGDVIDQQLRQQLTKTKLAEILKIQEKERKEEAHLPRKCLFCKTVCVTRASLFRHMFTVHSFNIGLPDNLVYVSHFLDILSEKLARLQCLYCERTFKSSAVLRKHMRKKRHFRISPRNNDYDRFYVINYLEPGKNWEMLTATDHYFSSDDDAHSTRHFDSRYKSTGKASVYSYAGTGTSHSGITGSCLSVGSFMPRDEDGEEDQDVVDKDSWSDWDDEMAMEPCQCLFCDVMSNDGADGCVIHMQKAHGFDLKQVQRDMHLTVYQTIILINYIRKATSMHRCPTCWESNKEVDVKEYDTLDALCTHMAENECITALPHPPSSVSVSIESTSATHHAKEQLFGSAKELQEMAQAVSGLDTTQSLTTSTMESTTIGKEQTTPSNALNHLNDFGHTVVVVKGLHTPSENTTIDAIHSTRSRVGAFWSDPLYLFPTYEGDPLLTYGGLYDDSEDEA